VTSVLGLVGDVVEHLVSEEGGHGAADLVVARDTALRPEQEEDEARGHGHLGQIAHQRRRAQPDEGRHRLLQEVHLAHQDVGGLGARRDLAHELQVALEDGRIRGVKEGLGDVVGAAVDVAVAVVGEGDAAGADVEVRIAGVGCARHVQQSAEFAATLGWLFSRL